MKVTVKFSKKKYCTCNEQTKKPKQIEPTTILAYEVAAISKDIYI